MKKLPFSHIPTHSHTYTIFPFLSFYLFQWHDWVFTSCQMSYILYISKFLLLLFGIPFSIWLPDKKPTLLLHLTNVTNSEKKSLTFLPIIHFFLWMVSDSYYTWKWSTWNFNGWWLWWEIPFSLSLISIWALRGELFWRTCILWHQA